MGALSKRMRIAVLVGVLVTVVAVAGTVMSRAFAAGVTVATEKARRETLSVTVTMSGKTEADAKSEVFPPAPGTLRTVLVTEGQQVTAGQVLAEMDTEQLDASVDAARQAYEGAASAYDAIGRQVPSSAEKAAADAGVTAARRGYERACDAVTALKASLKTAPAAGRAAIEASLAAAETQKEQAYAAYLGAKAQHQRLESASDIGSQRRSARIGRDTASRNVSRAEANRRKALLRAPISGVVIFNPMGAPGPDGAFPKATAGSAVAPGIAPFTVVEMSSLRFSGQLDESDVARVKRGARAVVMLDAVPGKEFSTSVATVLPTSVQTQNGAVVFPVKLSIANGDGSLRIGMSGSVRIMIDDLKDAVTVPIEALVDAKDGQCVFVVEDGKLVSRKVMTGVMTETRVQIAKGLEAGETVAVPNGTPLKAGMSVQTGGTR